MSTNSVFIKYQVMTKNSKISDWMSFPEIGPGHDPIVNKTEIFLDDFSKICQ